MTLTEFKRFANENNIVPVPTEIYSQMISNSVKYAKMKKVLQEIRQEIEDFEEEVYHEPNTDYKAYASVRYCLDIIDKHIKEIEGSDKE